MSFLQNLASHLRHDASRGTRLLIYDSLVIIMRYTIHSRFDHNTAKHVFLFNTYTSNVKKIHHVPTDIIDSARRLYICLSVFFFFFFK